MALLGLLRALVRMDGSFTAEEIAAMTRLAQRLGTYDFWSGMTECQTVLTDREQVYATARLVHRDESRRFVYECLREVASKDGMDPREAELMAWLRTEWNISDPEADARGTP